MGVNRKPAAEDRLYPGSRITLTALPITSAGRFSPLGPVGIFRLLKLGENRIRGLVNPD